MTKAEELLCSILDCGELDLKMLDDVGYDIGDVVKAVNENGRTLNLNEIFYEIFCRGVQELEERLENRIRDLDYGLEEVEEGSSTERKMLEQKEALEMLNPSDDVVWYCNYLDTHICFQNNQEVYKKYLKVDIEEIEEMMGFEFGG